MMMELTCKTSQPFLVIEEDTGKETVCTSVAEVRSVLKAINWEYIMDRGDDGGIGPVDGAIAALRPWWEYDTRNSATDDLCAMIRQHTGKDPSLALVRAMDALVGNLLAEDDDY